MPRLVGLAWLVVRPARRRRRSWIVTPCFARVTIHDPGRPCPRGTGVTAGHDLVMRRRRGLDTLEGRAAQA